MNFEILHSDCAIFPFWTKFAFIVCPDEVDLNKLRCLILIHFSCFSSPGLLCVPGAVLLTTPPHAAPLPILALRNILYIPEEPAEAPPTAITQAAAPLRLHVCRSRPALEPS